MSAGDREAGRRFVNDLIAGFSQPDDIYYDGEASTTVAWVLSQALALHPQEVDQALSASLERGGQAERRGVLRSYAAVFDRDEEGRRTKADDVRDTATQVEKLAFERILGIVSRLSEDDKVLREACSFLEYARAIPWDLAQAAVPALLGTVALAADELTRIGRATKVEDPRPEELKALEMMARRTLCNSVMNAAMKLVLRVARSHPSRIARDETIAAFLETLGSLVEAAERLKAELVSHLGVLGDRPATVALVLPWVYRALMDGSQQVRAAGAEAYGQLAR